MRDDLVGDPTGFTTNARGPPNRSVEVAGVFKPQSTGDALRLLAGAQRKRAVAGAVEEYDQIGARWERREADQMEANATAYLDIAAHKDGNTGPEVGNGGEMVPVGDAYDDMPSLVDTVRDNPDMVTSGVSTRRLELAAEAGALDMAVDAADTVEAANSLEKMLAHQLATSHALAMTLAAKAQAFAGSITSWDVQARQQVQSTEAARMAQASARMMESYRRGLLTLQEFRRGKPQVRASVSQHVEVKDGGQAIVAGRVERGSTSR